MKLYDIPSELQILLDFYDKALEEALGDLEASEVKDAERLISEYLSGATEKIEAGIAVLKHLDSDVEVLAEEVRRLSERKRSIQANRDRLENLITSVLDLTFAGKIKTPKFTATVAQNRSSLLIELAPDADVAKIMGEHPGFFKQPEIRKTEIANAIKSGAQVPDGLVVTEVPGTRSLRIR